MRKKLVGPLHQHVTDWVQAVGEKAEVAVLSGLSGMDRVSGSHWIGAAMQAKTVVKTMARIN